MKRPEFTIISELFWLNDGDLPKALAEYNAALRMSPEEPHSLLGGGTIEYRQGQTHAALEDLAKSAQFSPSAITYLVMGRVYEDKRIWKQRPRATKRR